MSHSERFVNLRVLFLVCVCLACARTAHAQDGWLEWIEKMSGPGPFWGAGGYVRVGCWNDKNQYAWFCWRSPDRYPDARPKDERHILALGIGYFWSFDNEPRFSDTPNDTAPIQILRFEPRYYYRFHQALDAGVGVSLRRYSGQGSGDFAPFVQWGVTPASIVFTPLALGTKDTDNPWRRLVKVHLDETWISGIAAKDDFKSPSTYETHGEFQGSFAIEFDVLVFARGYRGRVAN